MKSEFPILGLRWEENKRIDNGTDSFVVPFPSTRPVNLVFHGEEPFEYGHYGIHLGQEDQLTFLGNSDQEITAYFIDCRDSSSTLHQRFVTQLTPNSGRRLCIPPGVAHAFDGLEGNVRAVVRVTGLIVPLPHSRLAVPDMG